MRLAGFALAMALAGALIATGWPEAAAAGGALFACAMRGAL